MRRRFWERLSESGTAVAWAIILIGAAALAATLRVPDRSSAAAIVFLSLAAVVANALNIPASAAGSQTLGPAVAAVGLTLFGTLSTVPAMAVGALIGRGLLRRRPLVGAFYASQWVLSTLAAGVSAHLVNPRHPTWSQATFIGQVDAGYITAMVAAAAAFVTVSAALAGWRLTLDRRPISTASLGPIIAFESFNTVVLFALGAIIGLVGNGALSRPAMFITLPVVLAGVMLHVYASHRQAAAELEVFYGAMAEVNRAASVVEIAQTVAAGLDRLVAPDISTIWLRGPGEREATIVHYRGPGGVEFARQLEPLGLTEQVMRSGRSVRVGDYERDARRNPRAETLFGPGVIRSALMVPITAGGETWGAIGLITGAPHQFTARHERLAGALAAQAALAIRNAHLLTDARRQAERISALQHVGLLAGTSLDPDEACQHLVARAAETLGTKYAFLVTFDPRTRELQGQAAHGADASSFNALRSRLDGEPGALHEAARAIRERRTVFCDESQIKTSPCPAFHALPDARCSLTAPLLRQGRPIGALMAVDTEPRQFTQTEMTALEAIAAQGVVIIENARLYVAGEVQLRQMEAMVGVFSRLGATLDLRSAFGMAAEGAREVLGADRCLLFAWDGHGPITEVFAGGLSDEFAGFVRLHGAATIGRHLAQASHPVIVGNLLADPRTGSLRDACEREGLRSGVFFPLRSQGELVGILALLDTVAREIPADALRLAEIFADQVAAAVRNATRLAQSERRRDELALLNRIMGSVSASLNLVEVFHTAAIELAAALNIPRVAIYRVEGPLLRLAAQVGASDAPGEVPVTAGVMGRVVRTGRPEFVPNVRDDPDYILSSFEVTSMAAAPITQDGATSGVIMVEGIGARPVTPQMFEFISAYAQQLSVNASNASFYEEQRRAHDELQVLYEAAKAVSGTLELRTVLDSLVSVTCRAFDYEEGTLFMVDAESGDLTVEAAYGFQESVLGTHFPAGAGIVGWVARTGTPVLVDDVRTDSRYRQVDERTRSELAVPLIAEGKVLGVFNVENSRLAAFGQRDLRLLTTLASYAVVAIQNARLYEQAQRLAITDGLTELYNHRYLHEALDRILERARRDIQPLGLIMLEIDHFKRYNDTYGHQSGDETLRTVAGLLRRGSRPSDIVARYGGDEFMVILPGATKTATLETAERLRRAVEAYPLILGDEVITTVTLSVGVATFPHDGRTVDALVEAVDRAQYIAKRSGGNKVHIAHGA